MTLFELCESIALENIYICAERDPGENSVLISELIADKLTDRAAAEYEKVLSGDVITIANVCSKTAVYIDSDTETIDEFSKSIQNPEYYR